MYYGTGVRHITLTPIVGSHMVGGHHITINASTVLSYWIAVPYPPYSVTFHLFVTGIWDTGAQGASGISQIPVMTLLLPYWRSSHTTNESGSIVPVVTCTSTDIRYIELITCNELDQQLLTSVPHTYDHALSISKTGSCVNMVPYACIIGLHCVITSHPGFM
jgi:hypothetical protein